MTWPENWRELPVWRCGNCESDGWATDEPSPTCPECGHPAERAGFTWGEAKEAEERFLCAIPVTYSIPVPELVQLSTLPRTRWEGLPVFHPTSQQEGEGGVICDWRIYDVGVVVSVGRDPDFGDWRCVFQGACGDQGWVLRYSATNLWVPKVLARQLEMATRSAGRTGPQARRRGRPS